MEKVEINLEELIQKRDELNKLIEQTMNERREGALHTVRQLVAAYGFTATDLGIKNTSKSRGITPKYVGPSGELWAGRGRKPEWVKKALDEGKDIEEFRIKG